MKKNKQANGAAKKKKPRKKFVRNGTGPLHDTRGLAAALDESVFWVRNMRRSGKIPAIKLGYRSFRYRLQDVLEALEQRTIHEV